MAEFKYRASDESGKITEGAISAANKKIANAMLASMKLSPLSVKAVSEVDAEAKPESESNLRKAGGEKTALALVKKLQQLCGTGGMPVSDALKR